MTRNERTRALWEIGHFDRGHGLEIGPLANPVARPHEADIQYVDVWDAATLRDHYRDDPNTSVDDIPEIDFPLIVDGSPARSLVEAASPGAPYDWVMASHVIEHVPDVIGWLQQVAELTDDGGSLVLAVPDQRYCFDVHRPATTVGAMLDAHERGDVRPSIRAVYDSFREHVDVDTRRLWRGRPSPTLDARTHSLDQTLSAVERARAGEYVDAHVWLFTPDLFLRQMHELRRTGNSPWIVELIDPTHKNALEFTVVLRRIPRADDATAEHVAGEVLATETRPTWVSDGEMVRAEVRRLRRRVEQQQEELDALRGSATWRVGRAVVAPLGSVRRRLRRT